MELKPTPFANIKNWIRNNKLPFILIVASIVIIIGGVVAWFVLHGSPKPVAVETAALPPAPPQKFYSPLTGREVADEAATKRQVTSVMIENSPDARPQSGLKDAGVVFEAVAEGGITRFNALYQEDRPGLLGPVRSLRPYYVEWAAPFDPAYAHVGGSARALEMVRSENRKDIDQFFNADTYYRSDDRYAPHNVYTTFDRLDALNTAKGFTESSFEAWPRKAAAPSATPNATAINVEISGPTYNSAYTYSQANNNYERQQAGEPHLDREAGQITPSVVIVLKINMTQGMEDGYREQIDTNSGGQAYIFQDGVATEGNWQKDGIDGQLKFVDAAGAPIALNPGQTWVSAIPNENAVSWQ